MIMAIYHLEAKVVSRGAGRSACAASAYLSCSATKCDPVVKKYLGITLLPQAGVAIGMCNQAAALGGAESSVIRNVTLFAVLVYELAGPFMTREALTKAGEIVVKPAEKQSRNRFKAQGTGRA